MRSTGYEQRIAKLASYLALELGVIAVFSGLALSEDRVAVRGTIILDRAGMVISTRGERIDDRGFFFADLRRWALAPHAIRAHGGPCSSAQVLPLDTAAGSGQCASASRGPETLQRFPHWSIGCDNVK